MTTLDFHIFDLDFPVGSKNKTATLVTGEADALLIDAGFTRADGHRLTAAILDSGKRLTTIVVSHGDPDFYFGAEVVADAFPDAPRRPARHPGPRRRMDRDGRLPPRRHLPHTRGRDQRRDGETRRRLERLGRPRRHLPR
jgi:glyoxylase-like metal-dependent hydrolase (beta-lactamase superfamily II)